MFCPNCGTGIDPAAKFCPNCGTTIPAQEQPVESQIISQIQSQIQSQLQPETQPALPMKWFKFLIYFALWAGGIINIFGGIGNLFSGSLFIELAIIDKAVALATIALGVFTIYTRFRLAKFYKNGPQLLTFVYAGSIIITFVSQIATMTVLGGFKGIFISIVPSIISIIINCIMIGANNVYFQKRAHLFTK